QHTRQFALGGARMKNTRTVVLTFLLVMAGGTLAACQSSVIDSIAESHIRENVPDKDVFDGFLKRDLEKYFKEVKKKAATIEYEVLRKEPTQVGISYPKFYAWVVIREGETIIEEGAVRLAAIDKERFDVAQYLDRAEIERDPEKVYDAFPRDVGDKIKEKIA